MTKRATKRLAPERERAPHLVQVGAHGRPPTEAGEADQPGDLAAIDAGGRLGLHLQTKIGSWSVRVKGYQAARDLPIR